MRLIVTKIIVGSRTHLCGTTPLPFSWRHGSAVRTSVFGWRTFPGL